MSMSKMIAVRKEFGEPFVDVVRGFAEMGYSKRSTAQILGFNLPYFRDLLARFELHGDFLPQAQQRKECRSGGCVAGSAAASRPGNGRAITYTDDDLLAMVGRSRSSRDFESSTMIYRSTVSRRFGSWGNAMELAKKRGFTKGHHSAASALC